MNRSLLPVIGALILLLVARPGSAQNLAKSGSVVRLLIDNRELVGRVMVVERDSVQLEKTMNAPLVRLALTDVQRVEIQIPHADRARRIRRGFWIGAGIGAVGGAFLSSACEDCVMTARDAAHGALGLSAIFGVIGAFYGRETTPPHWVPAQFDR